jgi:hypothetical protein
VYYQGRAFVVGSTMHQPTHLYNLMAHANVLIIPPEYHMFVAGLSTDGKLTYHVAASVA